MSSPTRRELVQRAIASACAVSVASGALEPGTALASSAGDVALVQGLAATELLMVFVYQHVLRSRLLAPSTAVVVARFAGHEQEHASALNTELEVLGGAPPVLPIGLTAATNALAAAHVAGSLGELRTEKDCLNLLIGVESLAERGYFKAIAQLSSGSLLQTASQIMACEAQHWTVLAERLDPGKIYISVPDPYVEGIDLP